ncbi:MAG: hypothetical protein JKX85_03670 [Phycisphaeraceae bacterium]|nr:hypothetical protein [Phycisphaeraceae bacterium]
MTDKLRQNSKRVLNVGLIIFSMALFVSAWFVFHSRLPQPAPTHVQEEGISQVRQIVTVIADSTWGGSQRGQLLTQTIYKLMDEKRIVFTDAIRDEGLTLRGQHGLKCIYIKVLLGDQGRYLFHDSALLCDVLFHESLHVATADKNCIEQECDAFLAGLEARCAFEQEKRPQRFMVEGGSIGSFVLKRYSELQRDPQYKPLATELNWVIKQSELQ